MRQIEKKLSELSTWDLDAGCRNIIDQSTPARRHLKKKIRRQDRKRLDRFLFKCYNDEEKEEESK